MSPTELSAPSFELPTSLRNKIFANETKFLRNEAKFCFNFCCAKRNETKFRIFLFHVTSEIFAKQARLSFREILKKAKIKNSSSLANGQRNSGSTAFPLRHTLLSCQKLRWELTSLLRWPGRQVLDTGNGHGHL
jgi:hypothetical protein